MELFLFIFISIITVLIIYSVFRIKSSENYKALIRLCNLDEEKINLYYASYQKIFNDQKMISTLEDYINGIPPAKFTIPENRKISEYTAECYSVLNDLCALGNVKKMYIPKMINSNKNLKENQNLYEKEVAHKLNVKRGGKILELGCGCGRIAHHISQETKCQVYGVNIDEKQLKDARDFAKKNKTDNEFVFADFNDNFPFQDNMFDAIYDFGAFTTFINNYNVFNELYRILKPGGTLFITDGVLLDNFDKNNKTHLDLMSSSRMVMAGGVFLHYKYFEDIGIKSGFKLLSSKGGNFPQLASELQMLKKEHAHFGRIERIINILTKCKFLPKHMKGLIERLRYGGNDLVEMEEQNLVTMDWEFHFIKPL